MEYNPVTAIVGLHSVERKAFCLRLAHSLESDQDKISRYFNRQNQQSRALHRCKILDKVYRELVKSAE